MKKTIWVLFAVFFVAVLVWADVDTKDGSAITTTSDMDGSSDSHDIADGQTIKSGSCSISDDFSGGTGNWNVVHGTWAISSEEYGTTTTGEWCRSEYNACAPTGNDQWVKFKYANDGDSDHVGGIFRSSGSGNCYMVNGALASNWYFRVINDSGGAVETIDTQSLNFSQDDVIGIHVQGSDTSTTAKIWVNPSGAAPSNWGAAGQTLSAAGGIDNAVNSGTYVGVGIYTGDGTDFVDDFTGGHE